MRTGRLLLRRRRGRKIGGVFAGGRPGGAGRAEFAAGELAVAVFVEAAEAFGGGVDLGGAQDAVMIGVEESVGRRAAGRAGAWGLAVVFAGGAVRGRTVRVFGALRVGGRERRGGGEHAQGEERAGREKRRMAAGAGVWSEFGSHVSDGTAAIKRWKCKGRM